MKKGETIDLGEKRKGGFELEKNGNGTIDWGNQWGGQREKVLLERMETNVLFWLSGGGVATVGRERGENGCAGGVRVVCVWGRGGNQRNEWYSKG